MRASGFLLALRRRRKMQGGSSACIARQRTNQQGSACVTQLGGPRQGQGKCKGGSTDGAPLEPEGLFLGGSPERPDSAAKGSVKAALDSSSPAVREPAGERGGGVAAAVVVGNQAKHEKAGSSSWMAGRQARFVGGVALGGMDGARMR